MPPSTNKRTYKKIQLAGAITIFAGTLAWAMDANILAGAGWLIGVLTLVSGIVGAWFNDG